VLIVIKDGASMQTSEAIKAENDVEVEYFKENYVIFNVTLHALVP
jgi:hypothetical protein